MKCPHCQTPRLAAARFCSECGNPLPSGNGVPQESDCASPPSDGEISSPFLKEILRWVILSVVWGTFLMTELLVLAFAYSSKKIPTMSIPLFCFIAGMFFAFNAGRNKKIWFFVGCLIQFMIFVGVNSI